VLSKHVYWAVLGAPDPTAAQSGFNPADLDLPAVVDYQVQVPIIGTGGVLPDGIAGGDLGGTFPDPSIAELQGNPISAAHPTTNYVLTWNGSAWVPLASGTSEAVSGDLAGNLPSPSVTGLQGRPVSSTAPTTNYVLTWNGSAWIPEAASGGAGPVGGDLSGSLPNPNVIKIRGTAVSGTAPTEGQVLVDVGGTYTPTGFLFNIKNYGAAGNGIADDKPSFTAAAAAIGSSGTLHLPTGTYRIGSNLTIANTIRIKFEEGAIIKPDNGITVSLTAIDARPSQQIFDVSAGGAFQLIAPSYSAVSAAGLPTTNILYVTWFGAIGNDSHDDTAAFQAAINAAGIGTTIFIPNSVYPYLISSTLRAYSDANGRFGGMCFMGEGGPSKGSSISSSVWWNGNTVTGCNATITHKFAGAAHGVLIDGLSNMAAINVGDIIEFWGALNAGNNGRFVVLQVNSATQVVINNAAAVQGDTNVSWLLEQSMFDIRATEIRYSNLIFAEAPSKRLTTHINWNVTPVTSAFATGLVIDKCDFSDQGTVTTSSTTIAAGSNGASLPQATINVAATASFPSAGVLLIATSTGTQSITYTGTSGGNQFTGCTGGTGTMSTGGAVNIGLVAHAKWGVKIGSLVVPQVGWGGSHIIDTDGYVEVFSPSNLENSHIVDCTFTGLEMASVIIDNTNGNSYLHMMEKCGFETMPLGFQISSPAGGQFNFYECSSGTIFDAVYQFGAGSQKPMIIGGHHEVIGTFIRDEGSGGSTGFSVKGNTFFLDVVNNGQSYYFIPTFGVPLEYIPFGLNPSGSLITSPGSNITVSDCWFDAVPQDYFISAGFGGNAESNLIVENCTFGGQTFAAGIDPNAGIRPFNSNTSRKGPYKLRDGDTLIFTITSGLTSTTTAPATVTFHASDTPNIGRCWGYNVAYMFQKDGYSAGIVPYASGDSGNISFIKTGQPYTSDTITWLGTTTIAIGSNGASLPQAVINVASVTGFHSSGTLVISTSAGLQTVYYTGTSGATFTGCSGGTGTMSTGGSVTNAALHELGLDTANNSFVQANNPSAAHMASGGIVELFAGENLHLVTRNNVATLDFTNFNPLNDVDMHFGTPIAVRSVEQRNTSTGPSLNGLTCANLGGTVTFTNNQAQALIVFDNVEPDNAYQILVKDNITNGLVAAGALNAHPSVYSTRGFLLTLDQAPGSGTSVSHSWQIQRAPTTSSVDPVDPTIITAAPLTWWIDPMWNHTLQSTTITSGSNGVSLPTGTINVVASWTNPSNTIYVTTSNGPQLVTYTGQSGTSFTGCTGGTGVMATGNGVVAADGSLATIVDRSASAANLTSVQVSTTWPIWVTSPTLNAYSLQLGPNNFPYLRFFDCKATNGSSTQHIITGSAWYVFVLYRAIFPPNYPYFGFPNSAGGSGDIVAINGMDYGSYNYRTGFGASARQVTYAGFTDWVDAGTEVAAPSIGQSLPQAVINVVSTTGFASSGTIYVVTSQGAQTVAYTGKSSTSFTGCTGGLGIMQTENSVSTISGNTNWELAEIYTTTGATAPTLKINGTADPFVGPPSFVWPGASNGIGLCIDENSCDIGLVLVYNGDITGDAQLANLRTAIRNKYKVY